MLSAARQNDESPAAPPMMEVRQGWWLRCPAEVLGAREGTEADHGGGFLVGLTACEVHAPPLITAGHRDAVYRHAEPICNARTDQDSGEPCGNRGSVAALVVPVYEPSPALGADHATSAKAGWDRSG